MYTMPRGIAAGLCVEDPRGIIDIYNILYYSHYWVVIHAWVTYMLFDTSISTKRRETRDLGLW